ncbi:MAG: DUF2079 domain-containing protein [Ruaniaceae bacterium]|nr:DUF2079 domain-containing protein [Ruaniaceae bacterium]
MRSEPRQAWRGAVLVAIGVTLAYSLIAVIQWRTLAAPSWDLGIFSQLAKAYSTASAPIVPIKGEGFNLLGDHFHPVLVLLGPLWWLWPSPLMLLVLQCGLSGLSAYPLTRLAIERLGTVFGVLLGIAYGLSWGLQFAVSTQFHEIAFAVPILAFGLAAYLRGNMLPAALWVGALVFVKEDLGITVAAFGVILALRTPRRARLGWGLATWGLAWTALATLVILPALNPESAYDYTDNVASLTGLFVPAEKWLTVALLLGTAGAIGLRSPLLALMLPTLAWRFAGSVEFYWDWRWHYSAVLMPIAVAALLDAAGTKRLAPYVRLAVPLSAASTLILGASLPLTALVDPGVRAESPRLPAALEVIDAVPAGARVETDLTLMARLVPHAEVYWLGNTNPVPDAVVIDAESYVWRDAADLNAAVWASDRYGVEFELTLERDGFQLALRTEP